MYAQHGCDVMKVKVWGFDTRSGKPGVSGPSLTLQWTKNRFNNEKSGGKGSNITEWHAQLLNNLFILNQLMSGSSSLSGNI